jgi:hypothetical protein
MTWSARLWDAHRRALLAGLGIGLLVLAGALVWPVTDLIAAHDVGTITGQQRALHLQQAHEAVRSQLLTLAAGIFVAGTLWFTAQSYRLARHGQVADRYANAIQQLGSGKLEVRIGSVYALERIARDSPPDHSTAMEVLAAFAREQSHEPWPSVPDSSGRRTRPDVEAAVTVIGRRNARNDQLPIDISHAELIWAYLPGASLAPGFLLDRSFPRHSPRCPTRWRPPRPRQTLRRGPHRRGADRREPGRRKLHRHRPHRGQALPERRPSTRMGPRPQYRPPPQNAAKES